MIVVSKSWRAALPGALVILSLCGCLSSPQEKEARFLASGKLHYAKKDYSRAILDFKNALRAAPRDAEAYYQLGLAYEATNDLRSAYASFKKTTDLNPKHAEAQLKLASLMVLSGKKELAEDAEKRIKSTVASSPTAEALNTLAFAELRLGRQQDAIGHLQQALSKFPADLGSSALLMRIKLNNGDITGAEELLKNCVAKAPQSAGAALALGRLYLVIKKFDPAEQQLRRAFELDPKSGAALKDLGMLQLQQGRSQQAEQTFKQLSALPDKAYKPLHGLLLWQLGQRDAAVREFEVVAAADPSDREARSRLVSAYVATGRRQDAEKMLSKTLEKNPKDADALVQRAALFLGDGNYTVVQNDLNQALHFQPDMAQAHLALAALHEVRGATLSQRQELSEALRLNPAMLQARLALARLLIASGSPEAALANLDNDPYEVQKRSIPFIVQRNWALLRLNRRAELRQSVDLALKAARVPDLLVQDAVLKLQARNFTGAQSSLDEALNQDPENTAALEVLVRMYTAQRKLPEAIRKIQACVAKQPKSAVLLALLGNLLAADGKPAEARSAYVQAKTADPHSTNAALALVSLDMSERKFDAARQGLISLQTSDPKNPRVWISSGLLEANQKNDRAAIEIFRRILERDPNNAIAMNDLAYLLATEANQTGEALKYAQKAKEMAPDMADVDDTLGWVLYNRGIYHSALGYLESAAKRKNDPAIRYHLAMVYTKVGDKRGLQMLKEALKAAPNLPEAEMAQRILAGAGASTARK
jgi:putative PEP-CTERM system TPR-repeat lipoprotein